MAKTVSFFRGRLRVEKPIFPSLSFFLTELPLQGYHTQGREAHPDSLARYREARVRAQTRTGQYSLSCDRYARILQTCYKTVCVLGTEAKAL